MASLFVCLHVMCKDGLSLHRLWGFIRWVVLQRPLSIATTFLGSWSPGAADCCLRSPGSTD